MRRSEPKASDTRWSDQFQSARNPLRFKIGFARPWCVVSFALDGRKVGFSAEMRPYAVRRVVGIILGYRRPPLREIRIMAQTATQPSQDPRAVAILAKNIYREFRAGGFSERDVMALAGELLSLVTTDVKSRQHDNG